MQQFLNETQNELYFKIFPYHVCNRRIINQLLICYMLLSTMVQKDMIPRYRMSWGSIFFVVQ